MKNDKPYKVTIDEKYDTLLTVSELKEMDCVQGSKGKYHILLNTDSYNVELISMNVHKKTMHLLVNGKPYDVKLEDQYDLLIEKMGFSDQSKLALNEIKAPMPGLILDIKVIEGSHFKKGDPLVLLEAMKMENIIKAPGDGIIKKIMVEKGASVDKGHVLIELEADS